MKKTLTSIVAIVAFAAGAICMSAFTNNANKQTSGAEAHPRIAKAITSLQDAIDYLNTAPDVFQGHKADAILKSKEAIKQLKICEAYPVK